MSFGDATVDLHLDATTAGRDLARFLANAAKDPAVIPVEADASEIPGAIETAVAAAEAQTVVTADASNVGTAINTAVEGADTTAVVTADASNVGSEISSAVAGADSTVAVQADASNVGIEVQRAVDSVDPSIPVNVPPGAMRGFTEEVSGAFGEVRQDAERTSNSIFEAFRPTPGKIAALLGGLVVAAGVEYNALVQRTTAAFETLLGSAEAASAKVQEVIEFARGSPFPRQVFLQATQTLIAFGLEADRVVEVLGAIQDAVAASGGGALEIQEITSALAEVVSTGRLGADTLDQLGIRGVDAAKIIGEQMGLAAAEVREGLSEGTIEAQAAFDALIVGMRENFGGAAANVKDTWVGAVDRIKAAIRDLSSSVLEPFISTSGGGALVEFANDLADSLRKLEDGIVPVAQAVSRELVPVLDALGSDLIPAVIDALLALAPIFGQTLSIVSALAPVIRVIADIISAIPAPVLAAVGAFLAFQKILEPIEGLLGNATSKWGDFALATAMNIDLMGPVSGTFTSIKDGLQSIVQQIGPTQLAIAGAAVAFSLYMDQQARAKQASREFEQQTASLGDQMAETGDTARAFADALLEAADAGEDFKIKLLDKVVGSDVDEILRDTGLSAQDLADIFARGNEVFVRWATNMKRNGDISRGTFLELLGLERAFREAAEAQIDSGIAAERWSEREAEAAIKANTSRAGVVNYAAALDQLTAANDDVRAAEEEQIQTQERQNEALTELLAVAPKVNDMMLLAASGTNLASAGLIELADELNRVGASEDALAAVAEQIGIDANRLGEFVEAMGSHLDTLRNDILEGLPQLPDIFARAREDDSPQKWAEDTLSAINQVTEVINNFAPNLDALNPWPRLREQAARQGPEVAATYAELANSGNTAILDATEQGIFDHQQAVFGFVGNIEGQIPTFQSTNELMAFLGAQAFTGAYQPSVEPGINAATEVLRGGGSIRAAEAAAAAAQASGDAFTTGFTPDAQTGMAGLPPQISAANVGQAATDAAGVATNAWNVNFKPDVSAAMGGLAMGLSGWGPVFNGTMAILGAGAAGSFTSSFAPDPTAAMETLASGISGWGPLINGILAVIGEQAALAFVTAFTPIGETATTAFTDTFNPNPWPALSTMIAQAMLAQTTFVSTMQQMAGQATVIFNSTFQPDPLPALSRMLMAAQSFVSPMGQAGLAAGRFYSQAITGELQGAANSVSAIVEGYARRLASGLNTILTAIGKPTIQLADGGIEFFARGGMENHVAQIAPAGAMRVWAEPETGGEAYIPLAAAKKPRSRKIAEETVRRLGGEVAWFQQGGVTGDVVGLHPAFLARLAMWAASLGRTYVVGSGFRSLAEQAVLYSRWIRGVPGQAKAAAPGSSMHNFGLASDGPHWGGLGPGRFGLRYPMSFEPWHVEPNEARAWAGRGPWGGEGFFVAPLPQPENITTWGRFAHPANEAMRYTYDHSTNWATGAFGDISTPALAAAHGGITFFRRPFDDGGTLFPGLNVVMNRTGRNEPLVPAAGGVNVVFAEGAVQVQLPPGVTPRQGRVIGRQIGGGIEETLGGRKVRSESRLAGG